MNRNWRQRLGKYGAARAAPSTEGEEPMTGTLEQLVHQTGHRDARQGTRRPGSPCCSQSASPSCSPPSRRPRQPRRQRRSATPTPAPRPRRRRRRSTHPPRPRRWRAAPPPAREPAGHRPSLRHRHAQPPVASRPGQELPGTRPERDALGLLVERDDDQRDRLRAGSRPQRLRHPQRRSLRRQHLLPPGTDPGRGHPRLPSRPLRRRHGSFSGSLSLG